MKKYMILVIALFAGLTAQASAPWANEVYSNFQITADTLETPQEMIIKNIVVSFQSNLRGKQSTTFNVLRSDFTAGAAKTLAITNLCQQFGASTYVNYTKSESPFEQLVLVYDSSDAKNFDFYWFSSTSTYVITQIVCRK